MPGLLRRHRCRHDGITILFVLRLPEDLHTRLTTQAAHDRRSINSEILHLF
ncbi:MULTISPECIES: Arc family DNA-binding protein [Streptomyces]|uniref:Arc family DNA-binding protein n=1 Tax=Streptomyces TaxID=1883 RepID=UPI001F214BA7|nr:MULTISPECIES: Arc family DNA-binding protein [Streptomyces]